MTTNDGFICPHCGTELASGVRFCRFCGASPDSGWNEDDYVQTDNGGYDDTEEFDYEDYLRREFPDSVRDTNRYAAGKTIAWLVAIVTCLALLLWTVMGI